MALSATEDVGWHPRVRRCTIVACFFNPSHGCLSFSSTDVGLGTGKIAKKVRSLVLSHEEALYISYKELHSCVLSLRFTATCGAHVFHQKKRAASLKTYCQLSL